MQKATILRFGATLTLATASLLCLAAAPPTPAPAGPMVNYGLLPYRLGLLKLDQTRN